MRLKGSAGIALVAGAMGVAAAASAAHGDSRSVIQIGGSGRGGVSVSVSLGSAAGAGTSHAAHWLGTLTIDGCEFVIYECEDVEREIVRAFRREGYRASERRGVITVDYGRYAPRLRWHSHDYDLNVEDDDCGVLTICLHECDHRAGTITRGTIIGNGSRGRDVRAHVVDRRDRDDASRRSDDDHRDDDRRNSGNERRREVRERDEGTNRARPPMNLEPYRPAADRARPKIVGAWVPEAP